MAVRPELIGRGVFINTPLPIKHLIATFLLSGSVKQVSLKYFHAMIQEPLSTHNQNAHFYSC